MIFFTVQLVLGFYSRKIFLNYLGTEVLGLNTTAVNLLGFLNIAELGIGAAVGFSLYKPLHEKDHETICDIVSLQGHLYRRIASAIIAGSMLLMCAFPWIFSKMALPLWYAYASFAVLLVSALLDYFVNYRQIVLTSAQMDYKIQFSQTSLKIVKVIFQMVSVAYTPFPYVSWLALELVFTLLAAYSLNRVTRRTFPFLKNSIHSYSELRRRHSVILTKVKQLFMHKIGGFAMSQTSPLVIYLYISLDMVAIYGNYQIITVGITRLCSALFNSIGAGVGDLVAEGDRSKIMSVFKELFSLRFVFVSTIIFTLLMVTQPFVTLWVGKEYLLPYSTLIIICATLFMSLIRSTVDLYISAYGLFHDVWAPLAEAAINIGMSLLLGYYYGLNGILLGVLLSLCVIIGLWKPYFLFTRGLKVSVGRYIRLVVTHSASAVAIGAAVVAIMSIINIEPTRNYINLTAYTLLCSTLFAIGMAAVTSLFKMGFDSFVHRFINLIMKK